MFLKKNRWIKLASVFMIFSLLLGFGSFIMPGTANAAGNSVTIKLDGEVKKTFTWEELQAMKNDENKWVGPRLYSTINTWPTKKWYVAEGVKLAELLEEAGIKDEAKLIIVKCSDGFRATFTKKQLLDDERYYFPGLKENHEYFGHIPGSADKKELVDTILALRSAESDDFASMNDRNAPLLIFGQCWVTEQTNQVFAKSVSEIEVSTADPEKWDAPTAEPSGGTVPAGTLVRLNSLGMDADKIYYTTDGSDPTCKSPMYNWIAKRWWSSRPDELDEINHPIEITADTTIKAVTIGLGKEDSDIVTFEYQVPGLEPAPEITADTTDNTVGKSIDLTFEDDEAWRNAITEVLVNDSVVASDKYTLAAGKLTIEAGIFTAAGDYTVKIKATGYQDTFVTQTIVAAPTVFTVSINGEEAVSYSLAEIKAMPATTKTYGETGFYIRKGVDFISLLESLGIDYNSCTVKLIMTDVPNGYTLNFSNVIEPLLAYEESVGGSEFNPIPLKLYYGDGSNHKLVYQNVVGIDVIRPETLTPPLLEADITDNTVGKSIDLTFEDDEAWRNAITEVLVNDSVVASDKYTLAAGKLTIEAGIFTAAGDYTVKIKATGYNDATVTQTIVAAGPRTRYVDGSGGADFTTIQAAVDAANAGDTIIVKDGTYSENVTVDKTLTIRSENGASSTTVIAVDPTTPVFKVSVSGVVIDGFSVQGSTSKNVAGIELTDVNECTIQNNDCSGCYNGIHLGGAAAENVVIGNRCHGNSKSGISIRNTAHDNFISRNTVENNTDAGFCIKDQSKDNVLWLNNIIGNRVDILTANVYHSPEPLPYTYNGSNYTGYLGNHWDSYTGTDADGDGIGDTPYSFGTNSDDYPLMALSANYVEIKTRYVDGSGGADFTTIQAAVDAANAGDTIIVKDGTYNENVVVNKSLVIKSENGADRTVVQAADAKADVFEVTAENVTIDGFTATGATSYDKSGIAIKGSSDASCTVINNKCSGNSKGIAITGAKNNTVVNNICAHNDYTGIHLFSTTGNTITGNTVSENTADSGFAIYLADNANNNSVSGNISDSNNIGVRVKNAYNNVIFNNTFSNNSYGLEIATKSTGNIFYLNNFVDNTSAQLNPGYGAIAGNFWNSQEELSYEFKGTQYSGYVGNYWSDYTGEDADGNGIGDTPYQTIATDSDNYPLIGKWDNGVITAPAEPQILLSCDSGIPGVTTFITGSGFGADTAGTIWFDTNNNGVLDEGEPSVDLTTDANGDIPLLTSLIVPSSGTGSYAVRADIGGIEATDSFTITDSGIIVSPTSGNPRVSSGLTVTGSGFAPNTRFRLFCDRDGDGLFDGGMYRDGTTTASGTVSVTGMSWPSAPTGIYNIILDLNYDDTIDAYASICVVPSIKISNPRGVPGTNIGMNIDGFEANATGYVWFDTNGNGVWDEDENRVSVTTSGAGTATTPGLYVPSAAPGDYQVCAEIPARGLKTSAAYSISGIILNPSSGVAGAKIDIAGYGYVPNQTSGRYIWLDTNGNGTWDTDEPKVDVTTDANGTLSPVSLIAPAVPAGDYNVCAYVYPIGTSAVFTLNDSPLEPANYVVTFAVIDGENAVEGAAIEVKDSEDQVVTPEDDGTYKLEAGVYTYTVTKEGYKAAQGTITVGATDMTVTVNLEKEAEEPVTPPYRVVPTEDAVYTVGETADGIKTMTVNDSQTGLKYFTVSIESAGTYEGTATVVFVHLRDNIQLQLNALKADFDEVRAAKAGFNVNPGDVIKVYIVDELTNDSNSNPLILQ